MPQASEALRQIWHYNSDYDAERFLHDRGFMLTRRYTWVPPTPKTWAQLDDKERSAIAYLADEWDFGGLE